VQSKKIDGEKMKPFNLISPCIKCGSKAAKYQHVRKGDGGFYGCVKGEHMHRTCRFCSFSWDESPLDQTDPLKDIQEFAEKRKDEGKSPFVEGENPLVQSSTHPCPICFQTNCKIHVKMMWEDEKTTYEQNGFIDVNTDHRIIGDLKLEISEIFVYLDLKVKENKRGFSFKVFHPETGEVAKDQKVFYKYEYIAELDNSPPSDEEDLVCPECGDDFMGHHSRVRLDLHLRKDHAKKFRRDDFDPANAIINDIFLDISDRRGIKHEWNKIDDDVKDEIRQHWKSLIEYAYQKENETG